MLLPASPTPPLDLPLRQLQMHQPLDTLNKRHLPHDIAFPARGGRARKVRIHSALRRSVRGRSRGRGDVGVPADEVQSVAALALPLVHAAGDVVGAADFEHDGFGVLVGGGWVVGAVVGEFGEDVADAAVGVRAGWGEEGARGGLRGLGVGLWGEPEDVDVAFFVVGADGFDELG
jgi:hypothetical protein